jgi:hypothetical protein
VNKYRGTVKSKMLVDLKKDPKENENAFWQYEGAEILNELESKLSQYKDLNHR